MEVLKIRNIFSDVVKVMTIADHKQYLRDHSEKTKNRKKTKLLRVAKLSCGSVIVVNHETQTHLFGNIETSKTNNTVYVPKDRVEVWLTPKEIYIDE